MSYSLTTKIGTDKYEVVLKEDGTVHSVDHFKPMRGQVPWLRRNLFRATSSQDVIDWHMEKLTVRVAISLAQAKQKELVAA